MLRVALLVGVLLGDSPFTIPPPQNLVSSEVRLTEGFESTADYDTACAGPSMRYDFDGALACPYTTDVAPAGIMVHPPDNFPGGTQAAGNLVLRGGIDEKISTILDWSAGNAAPGADTTTAAIALGSAAAANCDCTWGTTWCASGCTTNNLTATDLASCLDACTGIDATASAAVVRVSIDPTEGRVRSVVLSRSDAALNSVANGTDGVVDFGGVALYADNASGPYLENAASSATNPTLIPDRASLTVGIGGTAGDVSIITAGDERMNFDTDGIITTDQRLLISGGDISMNDTANLATNAFMFGTGSDFRMGYDTRQTPDTMVMGVGADSRAIIVMEQADSATDFGHALMTDPTLFIHSANAADTAEWIGFQHDQTNAIIDTGQGVVSIPDGITTAADVISTDTGDIGWSVVDGTDNTACTAQCTNAAVFGFNLAAGASAPVLVGPTDATADICMCAGGS